MPPPVANGASTGGPLIAPPYDRYLPPNGTYYDPEDPSLKYQLPDGIEDSTIPDPYCGRCLKLRSSHPSSQQNMMMCSDICGFCGDLHLIGTLYGTEAWYNKTQVYAFEIPESLHLRPSEDEERQLRRLSYIEPIAKYAPGRLPEFTRFAWALRSVPKDASVRATGIHNPCIEKMSFECERPEALKQCMPNLTSMKAEMALLRQLSDGHKRIHDETQAEQKKLRRKLQEANQELTKLKKRVEFLEKEKICSNDQTNSKRRRLVIENASEASTTNSETEVRYKGEVVGIDFDLLNRMLGGK